MKFVAEREDLLSALDRVRRVSPSAKEAIHSARARLSAADDTLTVDGSDLTIFMSCRLPATVSIGGEIGVIPSELAEMVRRMPEGSKISIAAAEGRLKVTAEGSKRTFQLPYVLTADMPTHRGASPAGIVTVAGDVLAAHMKRVVVAAYHGGDRANMAGVGVDGRGMCLRLAATDGLRVAVTEVDGVIGDGGDRVSVLHIAAARVIAAEAGDMGNVGVVVDERGFSFTSEKFDIYVPHVGGEFPPYELVFSALETHTHASIDVKELLGAVQAMNIVSKSTKLSLRNGVHLFAYGPNDNAEDEVSGTVEGDGGTVYVSTPLLLDALKGAPHSKIDIAIGKDPSPILLSSDGYRALIMPISPSAMGEAA